VTDKSFDKEVLGRMMKLQRAFDNLKGRVKRIEEKHDIAGFQQQLNGLDKRLRLVEKSLLDTRQRLAVESISRECDEILIVLDLTADPEDPRKANASKKVVTTAASARERAKSSNTPESVAKEVSSLWKKELKN